MNSSVRNKEDQPVRSDTHAPLWFHTQDARLSDRTRTAIESSEHECWYSVIVLWENAIKHALGKLELLDGKCEGMSILTADNEFFPEGSFLSVTFDHGFQDHNSPRTAQSGKSTTHEQDPAPRFRHSHEVREPFCF
jgi:PIN domain nuclease of toxin-antitoxin system